MSNLKRTILIVTIPVIVCGLLAFGGPLYFASQVSAVYPPIEKYDYSKSYPELIKKLDELHSANPSISYTVTDTTGRQDNGYSYYITINNNEGNNHNEYNIAYKTDDSWFTKNKTKIYLIGAFDKLKNLGGYKSEDIGVKDLVNTFEKKLLPFL
jgi:hypothetical protein